MKKKKSLDWELNSTLTPNFSCRICTPERLYCILETIEISNIEQVEETCFEKISNENGTKMNCQNQSVTVYIINK